MLTNDYKEGLISIICLGYKHVNFIKENILALWNNKYTNIEIIAIDDGSNDGSDILLHDLAQKSPFPMTVIAQENTGNVAKNFNIGIKIAKGEFLAIMSFDDVLTADSLSSKVGLMKRYKNIAFIFNDELISIDENSNILAKISPFKVLEMEDCSAKNLLEMEYSKFGTYFIQGSLFRHDVVDKIQAFDEDLLGDDIVLRIKLYQFLLENPEYTFRVFPHSACYLRNHNNNIHKNTLRQVKIVAEVLERFFPTKNIPDTLYSWLHSAISNASFEDSLALFAHNKTLSKLLVNPLIQNMVKSRALHSILNK